jgi:hypothetical protein
VLAKLEEPRNEAHVEAAPLPPAADPMISPGEGAQALSLEAAQASPEATQVEPPAEPGSLKRKELQDAANAQAALQLSSASPAASGVQASPPEAAQASPEAAQVTPPAPPAIAAIKEVFNVVNGVFIHEQPTINAKRLGGLDKGQNVLVTGRVVGANWFRVDMDHGGIGYVYGMYLRKQDAPKPKRSPQEPDPTVQLPLDLPLHRLLPFPKRRKASTSPRDWVPSGTAFP